VNESTPLIVFTVNVSTPSIVFTVNVSVIFVLPFIVNVLVGPNVLIVLSLIEKLDRLTILDKLPTNSSIC
jgi:hypothetical protein